MSENDAEVYNGPYAGQEDKTVKVELYDAAQGKAPRTGGPYLDDVERHNAETWRAQQEGREPDYDNPGPVAGTRLVPKHELVERDTDKSHYSDAVAVTNEPVASYVVEPDKNEADPSQPDWDNDSSKVAALEAGERFAELRDKAAARQETNPGNNPDVDPAVVDPENTARTDDNEESGSDAPDQLWLDEENKEQDTK